jgi:hypothetical protein
MTTCAITGCRGIGALLLHIKHHKENLLQAEYCVEHFSEQMKGWHDDIILANNVRNFYYFNNSSDFGYERRDVAGALHFLWHLKDREGLKDADIEEIMDAFRMHQSGAINQIVALARDGNEYSAKVFLRKHGINWETHIS